MLGEGKVIFSLFSKCAEAVHTTGLLILLDTWTGCSDLAPTTEEEVVEIEDFEARVVVGLLGNFALSRPAVGLLFSCCLVAAFLSTPGICLGSLDLCATPP